ncbi:MAG: molybdopterin synthase catalytic subunit [Rubritalea sp.]|jgi:molybdopterin synthase catalytic subunit
MALTFPLVNDSSFLENNHTTLDNMRFKITDASIIPRSLREQLLSSTCGGYCSFEGWVRDHHDGKSVSSLEYSCYPELATKEGNRIITDAIERFDIQDIRCHHRIGHLAIGEMAVYVGVSSAHRDAAFQACRYVIDQIKQRVPIWKKEYYADNTTDWPKCTGCADHNKDHQH